MNPYPSSNTNLPLTTGESESAAGIVTLVTSFIGDCATKFGFSIVVVITSIN
jgi:hypothetical protein